jgi:hypothetical protein
MTAWGEMSPIEFDQTAAPGRKARQFVAEAPGTLFPRLLPEPKASTAPQTAQLPGQESLFDQEDR